MQPTTSQVDTLNTLVALIAAHGVYALTAIFIFYMQRRAVRNLKEAKKENHDHFRRHHTATVTTTYVLILATTIVWCYANFVYQPVMVVSGVLRNLRQYDISPQSPQDPPRVTQLIAAERPDARIYFDRQNLRTDGTHDLGWVVVSHTQLSSLDLLFQHSYEIARPRDAFSMPGLGGAGALESRTIECRFSLDLQRIHYEPGTPIMLRYVRPPEDRDPVRNVGHMILQQGATSLAIELVRDQGVPAIPVSAPQEFSLLPSVWAAQAPARVELFESDGSYDPQVGRVLRARLGGNDLKAQLEVRRQLLESGSRAFKFMQDSVTQASDGSYQHGLVIASIARVVTDLEKRDIHAPAELHLGLAVAFSRDDARDSALAFFEQAADADLTDEQHFARGRTFLYAGRYQAAIADFRAYLAEPKTGCYKAAGELGLGASLAQAGDNAAAAVEYQKAIRNCPSSGVPLNNLADLYANSGEHLGEALGLANRALELDPQNPSFLDTTGWVLHQLGRNEEALRLLEAAAKAVPHERVVLDHLQAVRKAIAKPKTGEHG